MTAGLLARLKGEAECAAECEAGTPVQSSCLKVGGGADVELILSEVGLSR